MVTWNKTTKEASKKLPEETYQQAELLCYKSQIEDEVKANPLSEMTKQFYIHMSKPFTAKEPEIPP